MYNNLLAIHITWIDFLGGQSSIKIVFCKWSGSTRGESLLQSIWSGTTFLLLNDPVQIIKIEKPLAERVVLYDHFLLANELNDLGGPAPCKEDGPVWKLFFANYPDHLDRKASCRAHGFHGKEDSPALRLIIQFSSFRTICRTDGWMDGWDGYHWSPVI